MTNAGKFLVTGASGFIGQQLVHRLKALDIELQALGRGDMPEQSHKAKVLIHLAGRAHISGEPYAQALAAFRRDNVELTKTLAQAAVTAGLKRLVYVSSIGVNGQFSKNPFLEANLPDPQEPYAISKLEGEQALLHIAQNSNLELVIVRPPLVYGANAKGNFGKLVRLVQRGWPLPLASVRNLRSLIYVENLVDALILCATHPAAAGKTYLVSDGEDVSTPDLLRKLAAAMGKDAHLWPCPQAALLLACRLIGKSDALKKLTDILQVDSSKIRRELGWKPPYSLQQGLQVTADWYVESKKT